MKEAPVRGDGRKRITRKLYITCCRAALLQPRSRDPAKRQCPRDDIARALKFHLSLPGVLPRQTPSWAFRA